MSSAALLFIADPKADLILKSSDNYTFAIRRVHLQSSCEVFDGMLSAGTDEMTEKDEKTGLTLIEVQDKASELDIFLRFIDRDQNRLSLAGETLSLEQTKSLIHLADKYGAKALIDAVDLTSIRSAVATDPPGLFGFAMSHGLIETARDALALFQKKFKVSSNQDYYYEQGRERTRVTMASGSFNGGPPHVLTDVPLSDLAQIPFKVMYELEQAQIRVLLHGTQWDDEAKAIKLI